MTDQRLRQALMRAVANAIYVHDGDPRPFMEAAKLIPRRDLTFVGVSILDEEALAEVDRPVVVDPGVVLTDKQHRALNWHRRRMG